MPKCEHDSVHVRAGCCTRSVTPGSFYFERSCFIITTMLRRVLGVMLFFCSFKAVAWQSFYFPELLQQKLWDEGCGDWSLKNAAMNRHVTMRTTKEKGFVKIIAKVKVPVEHAESVEESRATVLKILGEASGYKDWVLPRINENYSGEKYFLKVSDLMGEAVNVNRAHSYLLGTYFFDFLWLKKEGRARVDYFIFKKEPPSCAEFKEAGSEKIDYIFFRMAPRANLLDMLVMELWLMPFKDSERELSLMISLRAKPDSLVYRLLPEKMIARQLEERAHRIFENFVEFKRQSVLRKVSNVSNSVPVLLPKSGP